MVADQLESRDIKDKRVLEAMRQVPRHLFVPLSFRDRAYADYPLPIGQDQTISQPYIVALMTQGLDRMVIPMGETGEGQRLIRVRKLNGKASEEEISLVMFVPMLGQDKKKD